MPVLRRGLAAMSVAGVLLAATACQPPPEPPEVIEVTYPQLPQGGDLSLTSALLNGRGEIAFWGQTIIPLGHISYLWHEGEAVRVGGDDTAIDDISDQGHVVGTTRAAGDTLPFLWVDGQITLLPLGDATGGTARSVNDQGQVAGVLSYTDDSDDPGGDVTTERPAVWDDGQIVTPPAGTQWDTYVETPYINNQGQVLVHGIDDDGGSRFWLWQVDGDVTEIEGIEQIVAMNHRGMVLGNAADEDGDQALLWHDGERTELGTLGGDRTVAGDLNEWGQVVGHSTDANGDPQPFLWHEGEMTELGSLGGDGGTTPHAVNNWGQVVGYSTDADGYLKPFLWQNYRMVDLGKLTDATGDWPIAPEMKINDNGQIIGANYNLGGLVMWTASPTWGYDPDGI